MIKQKTYEGSFSGFSIKGQKGLAEVKGEIVKKGMEFSIYYYDALWHEKPFPNLISAEKYMLETIKSFEPHFKFTAIDYEYRTLLITYRDNLILTLIEYKGFRIKKYNTLKKIKRNHKILFSTEKEARLLNEIFYISKWIEQNNEEN